MNLSILAMIVVLSTHSTNTGDEDKEGEFYMKLAKELIDNNFHDRGRGQEDSPERDLLDEDSPLFSQRTGTYHTGVCAHLTPTTCC